MYEEHIRAAARSMAENMQRSPVPMYGKGLRLPDKGAVIGLLKEIRRLVFPAYYGDPELMELVSLEKQVTPNMPPTFLWHTFEDEAVFTENSLLLAAAMRRANVKFEMHIFPEGPHGFSLATGERAHDQPRRRPVAGPCGRLDPASAVRGAGFGYIRAAAKSGPQPRLL